MATKKQRAAAPPPPKRSIPIAGIAFALIGVILVAAIVLTGGDNDIPEQFGAVELEGPALERYPTGLASIADDPALGQAIPTVSGVDLDGNPMTIAADGVPKAIAFLAHWCTHCQAEVPRVTDWVAQTGGIPGTEIVAVTTSIDPLRGNYPPDAWLKDEAWPAVTMRDDNAGSAHLAYGAGGFPYWVFVNAGGEVVARTAGELDIATFESLLGLAASG